MTNSTVQAIVLGIIFLPLINACVMSSAGRYIGAIGVHILAPTVMFVNCILSFAVFYDYVVAGEIRFLCLGNWFTCGVLTVDWGFILDGLSCMMILVVSYVSFCVHLFSAEYMFRDAGLVRFMSLISLFTFFMLFLVSSDNFIQMFVGWEGVGICSFLLISFWFNRVKAVKAALKALVYNRVGDAGFIVGMLFIYKYFKTFDFCVIEILSHFMQDARFLHRLGTLEINISIFDLISFFLLFGVVGKSAQIGLHAWLPDAMEGPTPVSALIHAATMVTAGIFAVLRFSFIFERSSFALFMMTMIGGITVFFGSIVSLTQFDVKKIIAYSTTSQLGYMLFACGVSNYTGAAFHLFNHAFIKALLFLAAGVVIHRLSGEQDLRKMGGLNNLMPLTYMYFLVGSLSLAGFPFFSGFYSKDLILEVAASRIHISTHVLYWFVTTSTLLTAFYSFRMVYLIFFGKCSVPRKRLSKVKDISIIMAVSLMLLCLPSIFSGYLFSDLFVGEGSKFFSQSLPEPNNLRSTEAVCEMPTWLRLIPTIFSFIGAYLGLRISVYIKNPFVKRVIYSKTINCAFNFDALYNRHVAIPILRFALIFCYRLIDRYVLEIFGPTGIIFMMKKLIPFFAKFQGGFTVNHFFLILYCLSIVFIIFWMFVL